MTNERTYVQTTCSSCGAENSTRLYSVPEAANYCGGDDRIGIGTIGRWRRKRTLKNGLYFMGYMFQKKDLDEALRTLGYSNRIHEEETSA